jgi:hypothetical protein
LLGLDKAPQLGCPGISVNALNRVAGALGDTDAAAGMQQKHKWGRIKETNSPRFEVRVEVRVEECPPAPTTTAKLTPKEPSPVLLTFASFKLIFPLEKTLWL